MTHFDSDLLPPGADGNESSADLDRKLRHRIRKRKRSVTAPFLAVVAFAALAAVLIGVMRAQNGSQTDGETAQRALAESAAPSAAAPAAAPARQVLAEVSRSVDTDRTSATSATADAGSGSGASAAQPRPTGKESYMTLPAGAPPPAPPVAAPGEENRPASAAPSNPPRVSSSKFAALDPSGLAPPPITTPPTAITPSTPAPSIAPPPSATATPSTPAAPSAAQPPQLPAAPSLPAATIVPTVLPDRPLPASEAASIIERARVQVGRGDIAAARRLLEFAADSGDAAILFALAETYDPNVLRSWGVIGTRPDADMARKFYQKAKERGATGAAERLTALR
jgi:hypothetical protein